MSEITPQTERVERTRMAIDEHRSKSLGRRVVSRVLGNYPDRSDREALRRSELDTFSRVAEDIHHAVYTTRRLNRTPRAMFGGQWRTSDSKSIDPNKATLPLVLGEDQIDDNTRIQLLKVTHFHQPFSNIGFFLDDYKHWSTPELAAERDVQDIGIYADSQKITLTRQDIDGLDDEQKKALEELAGMVDRKAGFEYVMNKPDSI